MALLKKIKSATLVEALVATVLIVIVFMVASLVLNNLLLNSFSKNTHAVETRISELEYQLHYNTLILPYREEFKNWDIELKEERVENSIWVRISAIHRTNKKEVLKARIYGTD